MNQGLTLTSSTSFFPLAEIYSFSAKERDAETGLSYFGSRYYSSDLSVWLSVDPISDKYPSLSPYVYCADNPVKLVDPNGEFPIKVHAKMVTDAFSNSKLSSEAITTLKTGASVYADVINFFNSSVHMDNMSGISSISNLYNTYKKEYKLLMDGEAFMEAGLALHAIADFYAHSNYIDLYSEYADRNGKSMNIDDIPTFSEALKDEKFLQFVEDKGGLKTGKFPGFGDESHKKMNKDKPNSHSGSQPYDEKNPSGPTKYDAALKVAQKDINNMAKSYEN